MPISMQESARYVGQSYVYDNPRLGPLTDRKIAKYQALGVYDGIRKVVAKKASERKKRQRRAQSLLDSLCV